MSPAEPGDTDTQDPGSPFLVLAEAPVGAGLGDLLLGVDIGTYSAKGVLCAPDGKVLADIFLGRITRWNDGRVAALNPGVKLPAEDIIVVHRSDGSGTTYVFVDYLGKVSPEWEKKVGKATSVNWPTGLGGKGNEGVTQQVKQSPGSIGYVELTKRLKRKPTTLEPPTGFAGPVTNGNDKPIEANTSTAASSVHPFANTDRPRKTARSSSDKRS